MPRPSEIDDYSIPEIKESHLWEDVKLPIWLENTIERTVYFVVEYWEYLIIGCIVTIFGIFILRRLRKREKNLKRLWLFILFFLSKRQMMLPLIYTLAKREQILDKKVMDELLEIRNKCRSTSLKKKPMERLKLEKKVSIALYKYFTALEKQNRIRPGSKLHKIVQDLEFIDGKLIELQTLYNQEGARWNYMVNIPIIKFIFRMFLFRPFELFIEKE